VAANALSLDRGRDRAYMPRAMTMIAPQSALRRRRSIRAAGAFDRM